MPSRLRIGVNALYLIPGGVGGTEIYLRNLLNALARIDRRNQYFIYVNRETGPDLRPQAANFALVETGVKASFRPGRLMWEQTGLARATLSDRLDILFSPGFTAPRFCRGQKVTVIHDLQHRKQPRNFGWLERQAWERSVGMSVRRSDALITVSQSSRNDIIEEYGASADSIHVVPHGVEPVFFGLRQNREFEPEIPRDAGLPEGPYLLAVSTLHRHKNWTLLLAAFSRLLDQGSPLHLAVCGVPGKAQQQVQKQIDEDRLSDRVRLLGWQPRRTLIGLFKYAEALVFPSTFEGFGMPVIEAMACGLPLACSDIPPLRETADGCAVFFDPASEDAILEAIETCLLNDPARAERVSRGIEQAGDYSWRRAAEKTLEVFLDVTKA